MNRSIRQIGWAALASITLLLAGAFPSLAGDEDIFSAVVPPNVLLMVDNSGSMNAIMEHPSFDAPTFSYTCDIMPTVGSGTVSLVDEVGRYTRRVCASSGCRFEVDSSASGWVATPDPTDHPQNGYITRRYCGQDRKLYTDGINEDYGNRTFYYSEYAEWLFSIDDTDSVTLHGLPGKQKTTPQILAEIDVDDNAINYISGDTYAKYQISRITAARDIARDVIYQTNSDCPAYLGDCGVYEDRVRFGVAQFQSSAHGGFVRAQIDAYSSNKNLLDAAIDSLDAQTATPLGETLFKLYTYFMPRNSTYLPVGKDGSTRFPEYVYNMTNGSYTSSSSYRPRDPVTEACQKNFVILITDGEPTSDNFSTSSSNTYGFSDFENRLIGDYAPDTVGDPDIGTDSSPEVGNPPWGSSAGAGWLDDIAFFMQENDCRPDYPNDKNTVDVYTVGFGTVGPVNSLLKKTAERGNGLFFTGNQAEILTEALASSVQDIISKSQGFSAATVPAARTSDGGNIYTTLFQPTSARPFWPGLLRSYKITVEGEIFDSTGTCALTNLADPSVCTGGTFLPEDQAPPYWNAATNMPAANSRNLKISLAGSPGQIISTFDHSVTEADLGGVLGAVSEYPPSANVTSTALLDEAVVSFLAGCEWGTGMSAGGGDDFQNCVDRTRIVDGNTVADRLGDIFHSNPVVVGPPNSYIEEAAYRLFAANPTYALRNRVIIAGANDGFLHGFNAGVYQPLVSKYNEGTGVEVFAFMPWGARNKVMDLAKDDATLHPITVDGSPAVADVWIDRNTDANDAKVASEWKTMLITGMREGGEHYLALDVTDPASSGYPGYLWEFPIESDSTWRSYIGQTWSQPVITRVRLERSNGDIEELWVAIVGFGYDATSDPNNAATYNALSTKGRGIMMIDVASGRPVAVRKFGASTGDVADMLYAIPSTPAVLDIDQDGFADLVYVGDLGGNVWKWVIHANGTANPSASALYQANWPFRKFFDDDPTRSPTAHARSFYFSPSATIVNGALHLGFGSGERSDLNCSSTLNGCNLLNRFFVVKDRDIYDNGILSVIDGRPITGGGQLTDVTLLEDRCPAVGQQGFYFEVVDGEKFVTNSEVFASFFFASTYLPDLSNKCEPNGLSTLYGFLAKCGQGFFGPPSSYNPEAGIDRSLGLGKGMPTDARLSIAPGSGGNRLIISKQDGELININSGSSSSEHGTLYWRELN